MEPAQPLDVRVGSAVVISGLRGSPQYNGQRGTAEEFADGRWLVALASGKSLRVQPKNLELAGPVLPVTVLWPAD